MKFLDSLKNWKTRVWEFISWVQIIKENKVKLIKARFWGFIGVKTLSWEPPTTFHWTSTINEKVLSNASTYSLLWRQIFVSDQSPHPIPWSPQSGVTLIGALFQNNYMYWLKPHIWAKTTDLSTTFVMFGLPYPFVFNSPGDAPCTLWTFQIYH